MITKTEMVNLIWRAKEAGYKNSFPSIKEKNQLRVECIKGFENRLANWLKGLELIEKSNKENGNIY